MTLSEKAAYIQGLAEGLSLDESTNEGKLLVALIDLVGEMADAIGEIDEDLDTLNDYIEEIDEDLGDVEEVLIDEYCDEDEDECDGDCESCDGCRDPAHEDSESHDGSLGLDSTCSSVISETCKHPHHGSTSEGTSELLSHRG